MPLLIGVTDPSKSYISICMKTTLNIDDDLLEKAAHLTGLVEKTAIVRMGLEAPIARESSRRLAALGGSQRSLKNARRRRSRASR